MVAAGPTGAAMIYFTCFSSETVRLWRPFLRRAANTLRPFLLLMRVRNPCLLTRLRFEGWYVLFIFGRFT